MTAKLRCLIFGHKWRDGLTVIWGMPIHGHLCKRCGVFIHNLPNARQPSC